MTIKSNEPAVRVLVVEGDGLGQGTVEGILGATPTGKVVRAASVTQARELWRGGGFDLVVAAETRFRDVLDGIFAFVGLFSPDGIVLDTNQAPLTAGGLPRGDVVGHRFVDLPWFSHSEIERARDQRGHRSRRAGRGLSLRDERPVAPRTGSSTSTPRSPPCRDPTVRSPGWWGPGVDVTVRRKAEHDLRRSQELLARGPPPGAPRELGVGRPQESGQLVGRAVSDLRPRSHAARPELRIVPRHGAPRRSRAHGDGAAAGDGERLGVRLRPSDRSPGRQRADAAHARRGGPRAATAASRAWWEAAGTSPIAGRRSGARRAPGRRPRRPAARWRTFWGASPTASWPSTESGDIVTSTKARAG